MCIKTVITVVDAVGADVAQALGVSFDQLRKFLEEHPDVEMQIFRSLQLLVMKRFDLPYMPPCTDVDALLPLIPKEDLKEILLSVLKKFKPLIEQAK